VGALDGKTAIVTGASSGIGAATADSLRAEGARVAVGARRTERLDGDFVHELDVTDPASCSAFVDAAVEALGGLDILVNNAGLALGRDPIWESTEEDEETTIETNVRGLVRMTRLCIPRMEDSGHIVNMGSIAGLWAYPNGALYCLSKAAVEMFTRTLREDLLGKPIRVTTISPGLVGETEFSNVRFRGDDEQAGAVYRNLAVGGVLSAQDVADCILFALTRPQNVNIDEIVLMSLSQSSGARILRSN
jgi:3-hydroxy acid dehydrogenase / malonic semialdehyde reductase